MTLSLIEALIQYTNQDGITWDINSPVPEHLLVYDTINQIFKKGNGIDTFINLPIWLSITDLLDISNTSQTIDLDMFIDGNADAMVMIDTNGIITNAELTLTHLDNVYAFINNPTVDITQRTSGLIKAPIINGLTKAKLNSTFLLTASSFNYGDCDQDELEYHWTLPDNSTFIGDVLTYSISSDTSLIGSTLTFKCTARLDKLDINSKFNQQNVLIQAITESNDPYITESVIVNL